MEHELSEVILRGASGVHGDDHPLMGEKVSVQHRLQGCGRTGAGTAQLPGPVFDETRCF